MNAGFYFKLAVDSIRKNRQLYFPYIMTCVGMIIMNYILIFLQQSEIISDIEGGYSVQEMLSYGIGIMIIFTCIFLFYTNSFLMRKRKKEFGLYNILGMGKKHIGILFCWEIGIIFLLSVISGLAGGILLSKLAELGILMIMKAETSFRFTVSLGGLFQTVYSFGMLFLLLFLNGFRQIWFTKTVSLLNSESEGEKAPKANWLAAIIGTGMLIVSYTAAIRLKNPVTALMYFFIIVLIVIIATYIIMISGSVALCKILQKNKKYYYKTKHFVSVSSMVYRMKRNGAGLATICILITMILVMLSSTSALYVGIKDSVMTRYPREINMNIELSGDSQFDKENTDILRKDVELLVREKNSELENIMEYRVAALAGFLNDDSIEVDQNMLYTFNNNDFSKVYQIFMIPLEDYNVLMGTNRKLENNQALLYTNRQKLQFDHISFNRGPSYTVEENLKDFPASGEMTMTVVPSMVLVVNDVPEAMKSFENTEGNPFYFYQWKIGFDTKLDSESEKELCIDIENTFLQNLKESTRNFIGFSSLESRNAERLNFLGIYAGLFYLGILLSIIFLFATVLIIYYKQISEGYEDKRRFEIMQKLGLSETEIRKSINSQMLTVFLLPIMGAGLHMCFAYPVIEKLLMMLNLQNRKLFILSTFITYLIFVAFYIVVYKITSNAYYKIVSRNKDSEL